MEKLFEMLQLVNDHMREAGFTTDLRVQYDNLEITGKEVIIKMPYVMTLKIPKEEFTGSDQDISRAVSQAISRAVSLNTGA
ncbi:hypothetical protein LCGC14_0323250 [marine sediment metagenome]|uniref:Uncharacterized protein n=1 Tax=marine sediment metagenome TaxID=412755 RepID=A0A0F9W5Z8_9ZZZZ